MLIILILIIFSIIVGPVNLFVFAKSGRRHRLFFTTPLISLIAALLVLTFILFEDGVGGQGRRMLVMDLESAANDALLVLATNFPQYKAFNNSGELVLSDQIRNRDRSWTNMISFGLLDRPRVPPPIRLQQPDDPLPITADASP